MEPLPPISPEIFQLFQMMLRGGGGMVDLQAPPNRVSSLNPSDAASTQLEESSREATERKRKREPNTPTKTAHLHPSVRTALSAQNHATSSQLDPKGASGGVIERLGAMNIDPAQAGDKSQSADEIISTGSDNRILTAAPADQALPENSEDELYDHTGRRRRAAKDKADITNRELSKTYKPGWITQDLVKEAPSKSVAKPVAVSDVEPRTDELVPPPRLITILPGEDTVSALQKHCKTIVASRVAVSPSYQRIINIVAHTDRRLWDGDMRCGHCKEEERKYEPVEGMILLPCLNVATRHKCALCQADDSKCRYFTPQEKSDKPVQSVPSFASCSTTSQPATPVEGPSASAADLQPTQAAEKRRVLKALVVIEGLCRYASYELKEEDLGAVLKEVEELKDAIDDLEREA